jgi:hypothetical protein
MAAETQRKDLSHMVRLDLGLERAHHVQVVILDRTACSKCRAGSTIVSTACLQTPLYWSISSDETSRASSLGHLLPVTHLQGGFYMRTGQCPRSACTFARQGKQVLGLGRFCATRSGSRMARLTVVHKSRMKNSAPLPLTLCASRFLQFPRHSLELHSRKQ